MLLVLGMLFLLLLIVIDLTFIVGVIHPYQCFLSLQILEAFSGDDSLFVRNCSQLISQSDRVVTMPQYEFRQICDTKLESIRRRISSYEQVLRHTSTFSWTYSTHVHTYSTFTLSEMSSTHSY